MGTTGMMGSVGLGLALTGIGVVGPFTMTCPGERVGEGQGRLGRACVEGRSESGWAWGWGHSSRTPGLPAGPCPLQSQGLLGPGSGDLVTATQVEKQPQIRSGARGRGAKQRRRCRAGLRMGQGGQAALWVGAAARHLGGEKGGSGRTEVVQQLLGPVLCRPQLEQLRVLVDELGVHGACQELLVVEHVLQEGDVGLQDRGGWEGVTAQHGQGREGLDLPPQGGLPGLRRRPPRELAFPPHFTTPTPSLAGPLRQSGA